MRKALNENPLVQAGLIGVLVLVVGLMLLLQMGGSSEPAVDSAATDASAPGPTDTAGQAPVDPTAAAPVDPQAGAPAAPVPGTEPAAPTTATESGEFAPGPGLPEEVVEAYERGDAVVLLIVNDRGIDDRRLKVMVETLRAGPAAAVFVTDDAARYSRITEGVDLDRTPALVIVRPKSVTEGPMPTAVVSYGFRGAGSVEQALKDALYEGPSDLPYYP